MQAVDRNFSGAWTPASSLGSRPSTAPPNRPLCEAVTAKHVGDAGLRHRHAEHFQLADDALVIMERAGSGLPIRTWVVHDEADGATTQKEPTRASNKFVA